MCLKSDSPEYFDCITKLAELTQKLNSGKAPAITYYERGECLETLGDLDEALHDYGQALAKANGLTISEQALIYNAHSLCRQQSGDYSRAVVDSQKAIELAPENGTYYTTLGQAQVGLANFGEALATFKQAWQLAPAHLLTLIYRGRCYQLLNQPELALADFNQVLAVSEEPLAHLLLSRAETYLALEWYAEAIADCNQARQHAEHETFRLFLVRGYCQYRLSNFSAALGDLTWAIGLNKKHTEVYLWRGMVWRAIGDKTAATNDLSHFMRLHPHGLSDALSFITQSLDLQPVLQ